MKNADVFVVSRTMMVIYIARSRKVSYIMI